ncbi:MAG: carbohydrate kinase family protein [Actinobacteria bacterium]|nr:carbohydrate kinase family protein [Actinomycetota bacterium]
MTTKEKSRICIIGDINVDVITLLSGPLQKNTDTTSTNAITLGGSTCNMAVWLTHLDVDVDLVSAIGDDVLGTWVITQLQAFGVSDKNIKTVSNNRTGTCVILVDETGARSMMPDFGANLVQTVDQNLEELIGESDNVVMSAYTYFRPESRKFALDVLECAENSNTRIVIDAASSSPIEIAGAEKVRKYLARADLVLANEDEFAALGRGAENDWTSEFRNLIVKKGPRGALWLKRGKEVASVEAEEVKVIDTTGAGDAFAAGLLSQLRLRSDWQNLNEVDYAQSLLVASHTAAENCKTLGATPVS